MRTLFLISMLGAVACAHGQFHVDTIPPRPDDVASIDGMVRAYYEVVNVPREGPRQWDRDRTLYAPWVRFVALRQSAEIMDHQELVDSSEPLVRRGLKEREIKRTVRRYGNMAHVDSTYEAFAGDDPKPHRGLNSLELYNDGRRWWIVSAMWQHEVAGFPLPPELLP
jgi:hypothetical protein